MSVFQNEFACYFACKRKAVFSKQTCQHFYCNTHFYSICNIAVHTCIKCDGTWMLVLTFSIERRRSEHGPMGSMYKTYLGLLFSLFLITLKL